MKKSALIIIFLLVMVFSASPTGAASPWTKHESYAGKVSGKFVFGLKNSLFGWMHWWKQAHNPRFDHPWQGFCYGIGRSITDTAAGLIHLATFPIPVDFPETDGL